MPAYILPTREEVEDTSWVETVETRDPETGEVTSTEEIEHVDSSTSLVHDWVGSGTFYYSKDLTQVLVITTKDDPEYDPAFQSAADFDALIESGDWDLPAEAFTLLAPIIWMEEPEEEPEPEEIPPAQPQPEPVVDPEPMPEPEPEVNP